ncbi:hypothetical protein J6590_076842 [Homalodisca vitripennis]|nr:hypothetical protein J6590_076842 [Homalodisca vitripennis]
MYWDFAVHHMSARFTAAPSSLSSLPNQRLQLVIALSMLHSSAFISLLITSSTPATAAPSSLSSLPHQRLQLVIALSMLHSSAFISLLITSSTPATGYRTEHASQQRLHLSPQYLSPLRTKKLHWHSTQSYEGMPDPVEATHGRHDGAELSMRPGSLGVIKRTLLALPGVRES